MKDSSNTINSLAHTKWNCKYHIVFAPKYRRKVFYDEHRQEEREILRKLCEWKGVEIIEGETEKTEKRNESIGMQVKKAASTSLKDMKAEMLINVLIVQTSVLAISLF